jgi:hypothetical protein
MSTLDELASLRLGRLKADAVAKVWLDDSATEIGELSDSRCLGRSRLISSLQLCYLHRTYIRLILIGTRPVRRGGVN